MSQDHSCGRSCHSHFAHKKTGAQRGSQPACSHTVRTLGESGFEPRPPISQPVIPCQETPLRCQPQFPHCRTHPLSSLLPPRSLEETCVPLLSQKKLFERSARPSGSLHLNSRGPRLTAASPSLPASLPSKPPPNTQGWQIQAPDVTHIPPPRSPHQPQKDDPKHVSTFPQSPLLLSSLPGLSPTTPRLPSLTVSTTFFGALSALTGCGQRERTV